MDDINIKYSFGLFDYCFSKNSFIFVNDKYDNFNQSNLNRMIKIDFFNNTDADFVNIYDYKDQSIYFLNVQKDKGYTFFFPTLSDYIRVSFEKYEKNKWGFAHFCTSIMNRIHRIKPSIVLFDKEFDIPNIDLNNYLAQNCSICLERIVSDNIFISECNHVFHHTCIWRQLEFDKYMVKPKCNFCYHLDYPSAFKCPNCRHFVEY